MGYLCTVRVSHENLGRLLDAARQTCEVAGDAQAVWIKPTTSGITWNGCWCTFHTANVYVATPKVGRGEIVGLMNQQGVVRPLPGVRTAHLPTAPYVVKQVDGEGCSGATLADLLEGHALDDALRAIQTAGALVQFEDQLMALGVPNREAPLFNGGPEPTVFLVACLARFLRSMIEICEKDESKWRPNTQWAAIAGEIAKDFFQGPWDELLTLQPDAIDYEDAGTYMVHRFAVDMGGDSLPRLSHIVDEADFEVLADHALPYFIKHWKLN